MDVITTSMMTMIILGIMHTHMEYYAETVWHLQFI